MNRRQRRDQQRRMPRVIYRPATEAEIVADLAIANLKGTPA